MIVYAPMGARVVFLGAGDAFSSGGRCMAAYLVESPTCRLLLDCGPTFLMSCKRNRASSDVDAIILSHLHGDHFAGIPFLYLEYTYEQRRTRPLIIAGPPGTQQRVEDMHRAMYRELSQQEKPFPVQFVEMTPDVPVTIAGAEVLPFRVPHQERDISLGLRLEIDGRTILYSGDTGWTDKLVEQSQGTDLFICECCYFETQVDFHLDYPRLARQRPRFGCRRFVITHVGREVLQRLSEVKEEVADDGTVVELP